ncbi:MAG: BatD family protein, partial [Chitinophagaceae bacterium]|nr:BatD family protein [Chitinophagaceae bacterium]
MMRTLILVLFTCVCVNVGRSQEIIFTTEPAARRVGLEDPFQVRYRIQNSNRVRSFELPVLRDFQILGGPSKSNQISIVNGERTVSLELIYVMKAKRTGTLILPGGIAVVDGREIRSNNMSIEVIPGSVME